MLATWQDAFKPHNHVGLTEQLPDGSYTPWVMDFPPNRGVPGDRGVRPTPWEMIVAECGFAGPRIRAELGFWCQMDFVMQPGKVIAERR